MIKLRLPNVFPYCILVFCSIIFILCPLNEAFKDCGENEFQCHSDGKCIRSSLVCDKTKHCEDNSDEVDCELCLAPNWHQCLSGQVCISSGFVCDGQEHCPDGDDEDNCNGEHVHRVCGKYEFTCEDKVCIPLDLVCDGRKQCADGSDETVGCVRAEKECKGFYCRNKRCLESFKWVCDGTDDCGDGSDEQGCTWDCTPEQGKFLCKDKDKCIDLSKVCNGSPECSDKSDEGDLCFNSKLNCSTFSCPKESTCHQLPSTGPTCICPKGYMYNSVKGICEDVDECKEYGICSQICTNTAGSYKCSCVDEYMLKNDNKTCKVRSNTEPLLLYTTQKTVVGIYLKSRHMYKVAENLTQVIGVAYDGQYIYWTNIKHQLESIVRSKEDGSQQEVLLTSGLEAPEDLAIDWLTGNLYFSDNVLKHISVCSGHGHYCKILITINVDQPRGIALFPQKGMLFWSDWGDKPMIAKSLMDGSGVQALITSDIHWPNCVTLDYPSNRLYWVDAKLTKIESINIDGSDRRLVLTDILKHPYGISVFEDRLYWSDWETKSIHSCNKITGKKHDVIAKDKRIYAVHVYHSAMQPKIDHSCKNHACSHLCLLAGNSSVCACPDDMVLGVEQRTCIKVVKKQKLYIGVGSYLLEMEHSSFGRHQIQQGYPLTMLVHNMEYNSINGTIFIADNIRKAIYEFNPSTKLIKELVINNIGNVTAMSFDNLAQNLYWTDSERHTIEVISLRNNHRTIVHFFLGIDKPIGLVVIPETGKMFIALQSNNHTHIDTLDLHGRGPQHHTFENQLGNGGIQLYLDSKAKALYWLDRELKKIEFANYETFVRNQFRGRLDKPYSMAFVDDDILWSSRQIQAVYWTSKTSFGSIKKFEIENPKVSFHSAAVKELNLLSSKPIITTIDHRCLHSNGGCSHICVSTGRFSAACLCPTGMVYKDKNNFTCIETWDCEFRCKSGECLTSSRKCNGQIDCVDGSDEKDCDSKDKLNKKVCRYDEFACYDGTQCLPNSAKCDKEFDCKDKSDEEHCKDFDYTTKCRINQHSCGNGRCVDLTTVCDGYDDCGDKSDEQNCLDSEVKEMKTCGKNMFQCTIGTCIPKAWECDGHIECVDGSDEHDKCAKKTCQKGMVQCKMGQCIDLALVCDGHNDCGDNSDEEKCDEKRRIVCGDELDSFGDPKKFQCPSDLTMCLDISAKCNKTAECPRGEDEIGCGGCSIYEFECYNKECVRSEFRCDSEKDCSDGSDEIGCERYNSTVKSSHFTTNCHDNMFDCKDGSCIDYLRVCDGTADCAQGIDESPMCKTACNSKTCQQNCEPSPYGAICSCNPGYSLNSDKKTCSDIDECESEPCAQTCENSIGSFRCSCYSGYLLRTDKTSCKSIEREHHLLFTSFDQARMLSENPITLKVMWTANDSKISGLDMNIKNKKAYFTIHDSSNIYEYNLEKKAFKYLSDPGHKGKVALDWITNNIYVVVKDGIDSVKVCNFEMRACARIIKFRSKDSVKAIAVDAINKILFYSVTYSSTFGIPKTTIYKSALDGTKPESLVTESMYVTALEADPNKKELYFMDAHSKTLQSIKYNIASPKVKILIKKNNAISNPSGLSIFENVAFITNTGSPEAVRCQLYGDKTCHAFNVNVYNIEDVVVIGQSRQIQADNSCAGNECSVICVQAELGSKCICHNGKYVERNGQCPKPLASDIADTIEMSAQSNDDYSDDDDDDSDVYAANSSSGVTLAVCLSIMGIILVGLCGYILYRRRQGNGNFLINMHFQNPLVRPESQFSSSPSVHMQHSNMDGKVQICRPIQRLLQSGKGMQITMETSKQSDSASALVNLAPRATCNVEDSDYPGDVGNFDDDPRARLVP